MARQNVCNQLLIDNNGAIHELKEKLQSFTKIKRKENSDNGIVSLGTFNFSTFGATQPNIWLPYNIDNDDSTKNQHI